jgi:O-antigen/teichoic acid export membrane protein
VAALGTQVAARAGRSEAVTTLRAMAHTGGASLAGGLASLLATKVVAVVLGPAQVALLATLQQLRGAALLGATLNGQAALVQGVCSRTGAERSRYLRTVLALIVAATLAVSLALLAWAGPIAKGAGLGAGQAGLVRWLAAPVALSAVYLVLASLLNAAGDIGALARVQTAAPLALLAAAFPAAKRGGGAWLVVLLTFSTAAAVAAAAAALARHRQTLREWFQGTAAWWSAEAAGRFLAISGALAASGLIASWGLIAVRARIIESQGLATAGAFDAAWAISMNQAGLVLASLQTYYLPELARSPAGRAARIGRTLRIAALAGAAIIAMLASLKPLVISTLYSDVFAEAARYLRWTLLGDYLKIASWTLSLSLVAAAEMRAFLLADLLAWGAFVAGAAALARVAPAAEAAAMAFVLMYAVHLAACAVCLVRRREFHPDARTCAVWLGGLAAVSGASALFWER